MNRDAMLGRLRERAQPWDIAVIGGGATGVGVAVDAAARGYSVALFERFDFGSGTSSRSTKLVHGGVRYLEHGDVPLVLEALHERGRLRRNAPHLVSDLPFIVPTYSWWEGPFYGVGLRLYDWLAGRYGFGRSRNLSRAETLRLIPTLKTDGLRGGVLYHDGLFDDARLLIDLARTAAELGAVLVNYAPVRAIAKGDDGIVNGLVVQDGEGGEEYRVAARVVINATGPFCDAVRRMSDPAARPIIVPSQGSHVVLPLSFLRGDTAIMVPHTRDGRILFAIPWHGHALVGTTDTPLPAVEPEPRPRPEEIDFILETAGGYLQRPPTRADVLSAFAGIRPLVGAAAYTSGISRSHHIEIDQSGLVTIAGGKWTTYRHMAEQCVDQAAAVAGLDERPCQTKDLPIHGADAAAIKALADADPALAERLHPDLPYTNIEVVWAARHEMARTVEDVLARRTRALFLNAKAAVVMAPRAAELLARELGRDAAWCVRQVTEFTAVAQGYLVA